MDGLEHFRKRWASELEHGKRSKVRVLDLRVAAEGGAALTRSQVDEQSRQTIRSPRELASASVALGGAVFAETAPVAQGPHGRKKNELLEQYIKDLDEVYNVPFFDLELPLELVLKVFRYLSVRELGCCAQASKDWQRAAEDPSLWRGIARQRDWERLDHWTLRHYDGDLDIQDDRSRVRWKNVCRIRSGYNKVMQRNWAERYSTVQVLEGRDGDVFVRQGLGALMEPSLTNVIYDGDRILAGFNDGSIRSWTAAEATLGDWIDTRGLSDSASAVRIVLQEQALMVTPALGPSQHFMQSQVFASVQHVRVGATRCFSTHRPTVAVEGWEDEQEIQGRIAGNPFVMVWDLLNGEAIIQLPLPDALARTTDDDLAISSDSVPGFVQFNALEPSLDGSSLVGNLSDGTMILWDSTRDGHWELADLVAGGATNCLRSFYVGQQQMLLGGGKGHARLYAVDLKQHQFALKTEVPGVEDILCLDGDAHKLVVASQLYASTSSKLGVYDSGTGAPVHSFEQRQDPGRPGCIQLRGCSPEIFVTGSRDGAARVWDLRSGQVAMTLRGHRDQILSLQMDELKLVTGSIDCTARVFDLRAATRGATLWVHDETQPVHYVRFSDRLLITGSYPKQIAAYGRSYYFRRNSGRLCMHDFSPAANVSRVNREFTSTFEVGPAASRRSIVMSAPYSEL